jgi:S1-C subfamily serine protease
MHEDHDGDRWGSEQQPGTGDPQPPVGGGEHPGGHVPLPIASYGRPGPHGGNYGPPGGPGLPSGYGAWPGQAGSPGGYGEPPRRWWRGQPLIYALVAALAAGTGAGAAALLTGNSSNSYTSVSSNDVPAPHTNTGDGNPGALNAQQVAAKVDPGVVDITAPIAYSGGTKSKGTGIVISSDGLVLTNNHVINGSNSVRATLITSGKTYTARVVGYDVTDDEALLQLEGASGLKTVSAGNSAHLALGTNVLAIGNAEGQGGAPSVAPGVIKALNSTVTAANPYTGTTETLHGMLQTSADIVSGDSGGPLANAAGQVIGMDTAGNGDSATGNATIGYAIPINKALSIASQIAAGHASSTIHIGLPAFLGVSVADASQGCQASGGPGNGGGFGGSGIGSAPPTSSGALICQAYQGTPAVAAGLAAGDVITAAGGQSVASAGALTAILAKYQPGQAISITYVTASGGTASTSLRLAAGPAK